MRGRPDPTRFPEICPLCLQFEVRTEKLYKSHVGSHLEQLALFSLPTTRDQDESKGDESPEKGRDSVTDNSKEAVTVVAVAELSARKLVKVFELRDNDWRDMGTGYCRVVFDGSTESYLIIIGSEDIPDKLLVETRISKGDGFHKQQEVLIVWTELDGTDMALGFKEENGCAAIWRFVHKIQNGIL